VSVAKSSAPRLTLVLPFLALGLAEVAFGQTDLLDSFNGTNGAEPFGTLVQGTNGYLYGTAQVGGANSEGTIFKMTPGGALTTVYNFCALTDCADGQQPLAGLVEATNGYLYGTTSGGSPSCTANCGTIFKISLSGALTTLHTFCTLSSCPDGAFPTGTLVQASNGDLYGTTTYGGAHGSYGTIFKITPSGSFSSVYSFCALAGCADGAVPYAGLIQTRSGVLYGTTYYGGANGAGTAFKITPSGTLTTLHSFCAETGCTDGQYPYGGLVLATNGDFYGTTLVGGLSTCSAGSCGTVFKMTSTGTATTIHKFCSLADCADGEYPYGGLVQASNGYLYGTTGSGGSNQCGTIFKITPSGTLTILSSLTAQGTCDNGGPFTGLTEATTGVFFGTTYSGGTNDYGTVFSMSTGLAPFVETRPTIGTVGEAVTIVGYQLTDTTSVMFNGVAASFTVVSATEISTKVPAGATSGTVQVVTSTHTLPSNVAFTLSP
jgi:uncharacterized repeat protein (TIGR03803 family)